MKNLLVIISCLILLPLVVNAQAKSCYTSLTFQEFLSRHTPDDLAYIKSVYKSIKYPALARENLDEGVVRVQIINHSIDSTEVIVSGATKALLIAETYNKVTQVNAEHLIPTPIPYFTEYFVEYDLEPFDSINNCFDKSDCNYFSILSYQVPMPDR